MSGQWLGTDVPLKREHARPGGMGLHICAVVQHRAGSSGEHVEIVNDGADAVTVTGLELTDCTGEEHAPVYTFPRGELDAGETAYVYSGKGKSQRTRTNDLSCTPAWTLPSGRTIRTSHTCAAPTATSSTRCASAARRATPTGTRTDHSSRVK